MSSSHLWLFFRQQFDLDHCLFKSPTMRKEYLFILPLQSLKVLCVYAKPFLKEVRRVARRWTPMKLPHARTHLMSFTPHLLESAQRRFFFLSCFICAFHSLEFKRHIDGSTKATGNNKSTLTAFSSITKEWDYIPPPVPSYHSPLWRLHQAWIYSMS